jgi:hypothetical protein
MQKLHPKNLFTFKKSVKFFSCLSFLHCYKHFKVHKLHIINKPIKNELIQFKNHPKYSKPFKIWIQQKTYLSLFVSFSTPVNEGTCVWRNAFSSINRARILVAKALVFVWKSRKKSNVENSRYRLRSSMI